MHTTVTEDINGQKYVRMSDEPPKQKTTAEVLEDIKSDIRLAWCFQADPKAAHGLKIAEQIIENIQRRVKNE